MSRIAAVVAAAAVVVVGSGWSSREAAMAER